MSDMLGALAKISAQSVADIDRDELPDTLILRSARPKRQREFAAGRIAAMRSIEDCGHNSQYPAIGHNRGPVWPPGLVGSITHTDSIAIAAVADCRHFENIGIDIEDLQVLDTGVAKSILTTSELENCIHSETDVLRLFSFKECIYKCVDPIFGEFIDFAEVDVQSGDSGLSAKCVDSAHAAAGLVNRIQGDSRLVGDYVVSACWLNPNTSQHS